MQYFLDHYFYPVDVMPENRIFSPEHFILSGLIILTIVLIIRKQIEHADSRYSQNWLIALGSLMLLLEIFRVGWLTYFYGWSLKNIRFDWCNQICIILPWIVLLKLDILYPFIDTLSFSGGGMILLYPIWIFYDYAGIHTMAVQSMISHGLMVLIPLLIPFATGKGQSVRKVWKPLTGLSVLLIIAKIMSEKLDVNYLLMKSANGIPVVEAMQTPWYWFIIIPIFIIGLTGVTWVMQKYSVIVLKGVEHEKNPCCLLQ